MTFKPGTPAGKPGERRWLATMASSSNTGAVLGETNTADRTVSSKTLPFTGMQIWVAALAGLKILGTGVAIRRRSRPNVSA